MEKLIEEFKNAITTQDLTFDRPCCVFNGTTEDRYQILGVIEYNSHINIYYDDWGVSINTMNIDDVWTEFCTVDSSKPVQFIYKSDGNISKFVGVDDCLGDAIDFNVEMTNNFMGGVSDGNI